MITAGFVFGWVISIWDNSPGKFQTVTLLHPESGKPQTVLFNTKTAEITPLYDIDHYLMWGEKAFPTWKVWGQWQEAHAKYEASKTNTIAK